MIRQIKNRLQSLMRNRGNKSRKQKDLLRAVRLESLERRELFAVDIVYDATNDVLRMTSDGASDTVEVYQASVGSIKVKVNGIDQYTHGLFLNPISSLHFSGNDGDDHLRNSTAFGATIYGGIGNDTLIGGTNADTIFGGEGNDTVSGGGGADTIFGDNGDDFLNGDDGDDILNGGAGNDNLYGGAGNDRLLGQSGNDTLQGGLGNDFLNGGTESVIGVTNNDTYVFVSLSDYNLGTDTIHDTVGIDTLDFTHSMRAVRVDLAKTVTQVVHQELQLLIGTSTVIENINGSQAGDSLYGNNASNTFRGNGGDDYLDGRNGNDRIYGDAGNDSLYGGSGVDYLYGGAGNDVLYGGDGSDFLYGNAGDDVLQGDMGNDRLDGGNENAIGVTNHDRYSFVSILNAPGISLGLDTIVDSVGYDTLDFSWSALGVTLDLGSSLVQNIHADLQLVILSTAIIEQVIGSNHSDVLFGNAVGNILDGRGGNDRLYGRGGNDWLYGGSGDDGMYGGAGIDYLDGQWGDDRYLRGPGDNDTFAGYVGSEDVTVDFRNGVAETNLTFSGRDSDARWNVAAGTWTDAQIEQMDQILSEVQSATGNTRLLKRANDPNGTNPFAYVMQGAVTQVAGPTDPWGIGGWNSNGDVHFVENSINRRTVFHEIGHNWDYSTELGADRYQEWRTLSGWLTVSEILDGEGGGWWSWTDYTPSLGVGDRWMMRNDAVFARDYGRVNPFEDMATTFEVYFDRTGTTAVRGDGTVIGDATTKTEDLISSKIAFLDRLFASLA